jgi:energy-coupling factor transporter ATP-binding protein EcfA2
MDTLMYSAKTRLPRHWTDSQYKKKVFETIEYLGLSHVMNSAIGDEKERGLSGGQRKRVNIGLELVAEPTVLFLDEPTSGLDSTTSLEVSALLQSIAKDQHITVAAVIHSPSPMMFHKFDDLMLLAKGGRVVYYGDRASAVNYFESLGFYHDHKGNEADFLMNVISGKQESQLYPEFSILDLIKSWEVFSLGGEPQQEHLVSVTPPVLPPEKSFISEVGTHFLDECVEWADYVADIFSEFFRWLRSVIMCARDPVRDVPGFLYIWWLCFVRACFQLYRTPGQFMLHQLLHFGAQ